MTRLSNLFPIRDLDRMVIGGYVRENTHPDDTMLAILNYTEKAQYERVWNNVTTQCRGLIVRWDEYDDQGCPCDAELIARPWPKFFNYGEHPAGSLSLDAPADVIDKMDGSLGILYYAPDGNWAIATRGSFTSEQAHVGTAILRERYLPHWVPRLSVTYLFEIIYPENRIVIDYGDARDLYLLGAVSKRFEGVSFGPEFEPMEASFIRSFRDTVRYLKSGWPGPRAEILPAATLREALELEPRPNAEGVVVRMLGSDVMVKIKQDDYVALHKLVTGLNERVVWEHLSTHDGRYDELLATVPDELHEWVTKVAESLIDEHEGIVGYAHGTYHSVVRTLDLTLRTWERKDFALEVQDYSLKPYLFMLLDGRDIRDAVWREVKPAGERPFVRELEEAA